MNFDDTNGEGEEVSSSLLTRLVGYLAFAAGILSAILVVFTLFITGYSVFQRYVLGTPLTWTDELSGFLVVAIVMLGGAETLRRNEHISVDLLSTKATGGTKKLLNIWSLLATAILAAVIVVSGWNSVQFSWNIGVYSDGYLEAPLWIPQSFLVVGAALLFLFAVARMFDHLFEGRPKQ